MAVTKTKVIIIGFVFAEPIIRTTANGTKVSSFTVRTFHKKKGNAPSDGADFETEWHSIQAFDRQADVAKTLKKGDFVYVEGSFRTEKYVSNGENRVAIKISAFSIDNLTDGRKSGGASTSTPPESDDQAQYDQDDQDENDLEIPL